jgi:hypothetical protein
MIQKFLLSIVVLVSLDCFGQSYRYKILSQSAGRTTFFELPSEISFDNNQINYVMAPPGYGYNNPIPTSQKVKVVSEIGSRITVNIKFDPYMYTGDGTITINNDNRMHVRWPGMAGGTGVGWFASYDIERIYPDGVKIPDTRLKSKIFPGVYYYFLDNHMINENTQTNTLSKSKIVNVTSDGTKYSGKVLLNGETMTDFQLDLNEYSPSLYLEGVPKNYTQVQYDNSIDKFIVGNIESILLERKSLSKVESYISSLSDETFLTSKDVIENKLKELLKDSVGVIDLNQLYGLRIDELKDYPEGKYTLSYDGEFLHLENTNIKCELNPYIPIRGIKIPVHRGKSEITVLNKTFSLSPKFYIREKRANNKNRNRIVLKKGKYYFEKGFSTPKRGIERTFTTLPDQTLVGNALRIQYLENHSTYFNGVKSYDYTTSTYDNNITKLRRRWVYGTFKVLFYPMILIDRYLSY